MTRVLVVVAIPLQELWPALEPVLRRAATRAIRHRSLHRAELAARAFACDGRVASVGAVRAALLASGFVDDLVSETYVRALRKATDRRLPENWDDLVPRLVTIMRDVFRDEAARVAMPYFLALPGGADGPANDNAVPPDALTYEDELLQALDTKGLVDELRLAILKLSPLLRLAVAVELEHPHTGKRNVALALLGVSFATHRKRLERARALLHAALARFRQ